MIDGLNPYPVYKETGMQWLGKVPTHWEVRRLCSIAEMRVSSVDRHTKEDEQPVRLCNYTDVYRNERIRSAMVFMQATATKEEIERFRLKRGDVLITKDSEQWNDIGVPALVEDIDEDIVCGYHLALLRPFAEMVTGTYLLRALQSTAVAYQFHISANGVTRYGLSHDAIKSVRLPLPSLSEQTAIVRFLEHVDRRIRRVIRARQRRIKLLEEYKQALVHQAVTGQIDVRTGQPYPAYKDASVEWLGSVPAHWEVLRLKYVARLRSGESITSERIEETGDYPVYGGNGIRGFTSSFTHEGEFVLIGRQGALCGNINYANGRFLASEHAVVVHPLRKCLTHWLGELLRAMNLNQYSIAAAQPGLAVERIQNLTIPFPPIEEQEQIDQYINNQINAFDAAISAARREIEILREYRERLVSDAVTGKVDVREVAARLPEEPPGEESEWMDTEKMAEAEMPDDDAAAEALSEEEVEI